MDRTIIVTLGYNRNGELAEFVVPIQGNESTDASFKLARRALELHLIEQALRDAQNSWAISYKRPEEVRIEKPVREFDVNDHSDRALLALGDTELHAQIKAALEGDSNDAEHDALAAIAEELGIEYDPELAS